MRSKRASWGAWVVCAALGGCGSTAPETTAQATSPTASAAETHDETTHEAAPPAASATPSGAPYELHEWGVVDVAADGTTEIAAGAGRIERPMSVRKPVVYAHLLDGAAEQTFGLRVTLGSGSFVEVFPASAPSGTTLEWPSVTARTTHCATDPSAARERDAPARRLSASCGTSDGICEVSELPRYDAPSAACLDVGGASSGLLFYRAQTSGVRLPITATRAADLSVTVASTSAMTSVPGGILRLSTALSGPWPLGRIVVSRAAFPAAGGSVTLPVGTEPITRAEGTSELRRSLVALGLTDDEASAFLSGWADELFGPDPGPTRAATAPMGPRHQDVLLYFLPADAIDGIASLTATPAPRAVHRAMLVRVDLGAVTTG